LGELVRESDTLARLGGDEFVLVADDVAGVAEAVAIARRIEHAFDQPFDVAGLPVSVSTSVGIALATGDTEPRTVLRHADAAMYQAKERGRACYQVYGGEDVSSGD
jgi:diguanylate cyclase (GGDEF)-like protein